MKAVTLLVLTAVAAPAFAQSGKPMSRDDFQAMLTRKYERFDLDKDGKVSAEEMVKVRPTRPDGSAVTVESMQRALAKKDANGDGAVTIAEAAASEMPRFDKMDANKDGMVTPEEKANEPK